MLMSTADAKTVPQPWTPPFVRPSPKPLSRTAFLSRFIRNPLLVVPAEAYRDGMIVRDGRPPVVWLSDPDLIKTVFLDDRETYQKIVQIRLLSPLLGKGILTSEGDDWKWQRQASAPMFRHSELMTFIPTFVDAAEAQLKRWKETPAGTVHDINDDMTRLTFDVISRTLLPSADRGLNDAVEQSTDTFQAGGAWMQLYAILGMPRWVPYPGKSASARATETLRASVLAMIAERRASGTTPDDLMARLMKAHAPGSTGPMTDEQLVDNLLTFYLAGHETTAKALMWTLYVLSRNPQWADAIRDEVKAVAGNKPLAAEHISRLHVTEQVIKESMRLFPPVPLLSRQVVKDTTLGGRALKAGTSVIISIYALQRHEAHWKDPHAFDPTRFAPEKERAISRYVYMPFGAGPRICIGMAFAQIEATAMLATLVRAMQFEAVSASEPMPIARVTLFPRDGMPLAVSSRVGA
jgi:cytochrome P450